MQTNLFNKAPSSKSGLMRRSTLFWLGLTLIASLGLYQTSGQTQKMQREVERIEAQLTDTSKEIQLLRAEWAYLNAPDRLARLAKQHLPQLQAAQGRQLSQIASLPSRTAPVVILAADDGSGKPVLGRVLRADATTAIAPTRFAAPSIEQSQQLHWLLYPSAQAN